MTLRVEYRSLVGPWTTPRGNPVTFSYRDQTNDWNTISSCTTEDEYGLRGWGQMDTLLDIGGYLGAVGIGAAVDHPEARVVIVEPVPDNAALIRENAVRNGVEDRVQVIEGAAGRGGEHVEVAFRYTGSGALEHHAFVGNTTLAYDDMGPKPHEELSYAAWSLADLIDLLTPGDLDLLKIDCEGGEWEILDTPAVSRCPTIVGEAHAVRGHKGRDIVDLLSPTHDVTLAGDAEGTCGFRAVRR